jgi:hypothetical protein
MRSLLVTLVMLASSYAAHACVHCAYAAAVHGGHAIAGTWLPVGASDSSFVKSKLATATLAMKNATFMYDTNEWSILQDSLPNESFDGQFQHVDGNIRGMVMSVKEFQPATEFLDSFVGGMAESYPGTKLVSKRDVTVNNEKMLEIQIDMPIDQTPVRYYGYLHAGSRGIAMALAVCHSELFKEVSSTLTTFTSGLVIARPKNQIKYKRK